MGYLSELGTQIPMVGVFDPRSRNPCFRGYPTTFHVGFIQESEERVNEINAQLKADGYEVPPPSRQHGSWTFYFMSPGGFTIEVLG
jgi:hypothetical protein